MGVVCDESIGFASRSFDFHPGKHSLKLPPSPFALQATEDTPLCELRRTRGPLGLNYAAPLGLVWGGAEWWKKEASGQGGAEWLVLQDQC